MANPVRPRQQAYQAVIGVALSFPGDDEPQLVSGATQGCGNREMKRIAVSGRCWLSDGAVSIGSSLASQWFNALRSRVRLTALA